MDSRIELALQIAADFSDYDGAHHKQWCIDQMVRALTGCKIASDEQGPCGDYDYLDSSDEYEEWVYKWEHPANKLEDDEYMWDTGTPP